MSTGVGRPLANGPFGSVYRPVFQDGKEVGSIWTCDDDGQRFFRLNLTGKTMKFNRLSSAKRKALELIDAQGDQGREGFHRAPQEGRVQAEGG